MPRNGEGSTLTALPALTPSTLLEWLNQHGFNGRSVPSRRLAGAEYYYVGSMPFENKKVGGLGWILLMRFVGKNIAQRCGVNKLLQQKEGWEG